MRIKNLLILLLVISLPLMVAGLSLGKVTVNVMDETGNAVPNAKVEIAFKSGHLKRDAVNEHTDNEGKCTVVSRIPDGTFVGEVTKIHFYKSTFGGAFVSRKLGLWTPWNKSIQVVLRPMLHPVPMFVRNSNFQIPAVGKKVGFDLATGDWVAPYGKGVNSDFLFEVERKYRTHVEFDAILKISFPNRHDGIQVVQPSGRDSFNEGSTYRLPRLAPEDGYQTAVVKGISEGGYGSTAAGVKDYIFRVRSESDAQGRLKRAMYGKILRDIQFDPHSGENGFVRLHYFLNPDYTRNLEFNTRYNLAPGLTEHEKVEEP